MTPADTKTKMGEESSKAKAQSKKAAGAATGSAAAPATAPAFDLSHLSLGGKIALGLAIAVFVTCLVYFARQALIHSQRAVAYAAA